MEMTGEQLIPQSQAVTWKALNDTEVLKACIPGCESLDKASDTEMSAKVCDKGSGRRVPVTTTVSISPAPGAVCAPAQRLRDHRFEVTGELRADLLLLVRRKRVHDAVHRARRARRVQRGEHQVAGFRRRDRRLHRLQVAHFAHEDHVRVLAQGALERLLGNRAKDGGHHRLGAPGDDRSAL